MEFSKELINFCPLSVLVGRIRRNMEGFQAVNGSGYLLPEPASARKVVSGSALSYLKACGQWQSVQRSQNLPEPAECHSIAWRPCT